MARAAVVDAAASGAAVNAKRPSCPADRHPATVTVSPEPDDFALVPPSLPRADEHAAIATENVSAPAAQIRCRFSTSPSRSYEMHDGGQVMRHGRCARLQLMTF